MNDLKNKKSGLLFGSYCADALSLGVHWIYDSQELVKKHGRVTEYKAPGSDSYHPHKQAGDQGHVGDQSLCLLQFLAREKKWDPSMFMEDWLGMWPDYNDYIDGATKATLANVQNQTDKTQGGSDSVEIAGPARIAPLIAFLSNSSENELVKAAVEQTVLTHRVQGGRRNCHLSCSGRLSPDARIQPARYSQRNRTRMGTRKGKQCALRKCCGRD